MNVKSLPSGRSQQMGEKKKKNQILDPFAMKLFIFAKN
jgi:hypothetical protein